MDTPDNSYTTLGIAAAVGFTIAIGKVLAADEHITVKKAIGRGILTAGLAVAGFALLAFIPGLGIEGKVGVSALMASMGATGAELLFKRVLDSLPVKKDPNE